jgi:hypothetical protein
MWLAEVAAFGVANVERAGAQRPLRRGVDLGRMAGDRFEPRARGPERIARHLVEQPEPDGGARIVEAGLEQHALARMRRDPVLRDAQDLGRELEAERDFVQPDARQRIVDRDAEVRAQGDHAAARDGVTVHAGGDGRAVGEECVDHVVEQREESLHRGRIGRRDLLQVEARGERVAAAGDQERSPAGLAEPADHVLHQGRGERALARSFEPQDLDLRHESRS